MAFPNDFGPIVSLTIKKKKKLVNYTEKKKIH